MKKIVQRFLVAGMVIVAALAGAAIVHGAPFAYIPNVSTWSIIVIDQATNKVVTSIDMGASPLGVALNAAGTRVYVTMGGPNTVSVINGTTQAIIGSPISVGTNPMGIVVSPDNSTLYVANYGSQSISVINVANDANTVIHTITGIPCTSLSIDPSGNLLYVASHVNNELRIIDTATGTMVGTPVALPKSPRVIAMNPAGTHLYIVNNTDSVYVIKTANLAVSEVLIGTDTHGVAVHPSGAFLYASSAGNVHMIDSGTNTIIRSITVGGSEHNISFNSDGTRAYVALWGSTLLKVIDTATHTVIDEHSTGNSFGWIWNSQFVAPHRHVWNGTTSFPIKLTGLDGDGKFLKGAGELTGRVIEMRTLGNKYSLLFLSDDLKSSIYLPDVTFLMTDVDGSKSEKFMMSGTGKYYFHDGTEMVSGIANFNGTGTAKRDGPDGYFTQAKMSGTVTGGILQGQYFSGKVKAVLENVQ